MSIISQLSEFFLADDIIPLKGRDDLFRCIRRSTQGNAYQYIYIDESAGWQREDVSDYIENILSDDYYTCKDFLQWNFYYYFLTDEESIGQHKSQKLSVEQDEAFARKFVITPSAFISHLVAVQNIGRSKIQLESGDLYNDWISYLHDKELHFVYDEKKYPNYKSWVDQYVEGIPFDPPVEDYQPKNNREVARVTSINQLELKDFRPFPQQRKFTFGKVNLIFGPNASGKTSFFDAMELCFTGQAKRENADDYELEATTDSDESLNYPSANNVYRQRDITWYKNIYTRGHNLANNFNKFNYYASDAAFLLHKDDSNGKNDIEATITDIALGREINRLEERINEFCTRFKNRADELKKVQQEHQIELQGLLTREKEIQNEGNDPLMYLQPINDFLHAQAWNVPSTNDEPFLVNLENSIQLVSDCIEHIVGEFPGETALTRQDITNYIEVLRKKTAQLNTFLIEISIADDQLRHTQQQVNDLSKLAANAERLSPYFADPDIEQLEELDDLIKQGTDELERLEKAAEFLQLLQLFISEQKQEILNDKYFDFKFENARLKTQTTKELNTAKNNTERLKRGIEQLNTIVADIKRLGSDFLGLNHEADQCPLCQAHYPHIELTERITAASELVGDTEIYAAQQREMQRMESTIENCDRIAEQIDELQKIIPFAYLDLAERLNFGQLKTAIEKEINDIPTLRESLDRLIRIKSRFDEKGFSQGEFVSNKSTIESWLKYEIGSQTLLDQAIGDLSQYIELAEAEILQLQQNIDNIRRQEKDLFDTRNPNSETIQKNLRIWQRLLEWADQIGDVIQLDDNKDLFLLRPEVQQLKSMYEVYRSAWQEKRDMSKLLEVLERSKSELMERKTSNDQMVKNASTAFDLLNFILHEKNKRAYLIDFMNRNKTEMVNIFRQIHAPSEFTDLNFDNQKVNLLDVENKWHTINEVSTGQRSAIALSMFLNLNQKLSNGPDVILLDDPVTYVDDLNTLSFLDYLRELVEHTDRQVFFATANADVAFLFSKKFDYMSKEEFRSFEFNRSF